MKYRLGLKCGGLMEDPEWHIEMIRDVEANSLKEAKDKWAEITGENKLNTWNTESQTVWGWEIVETNLPYYRDW